MGVHVEVHGAALVPQVHAVVADAFAQTVDENACAERETTFASDRDARLRRPARRRDVAGGQPVANVIRAHDGGQAKSYDGGQHHRFHLAQVAAKCEPAAHTLRGTRVWGRLEAPTNGALPGLTVRQLGNLTNGERCPRCDHMSCPEGNLRCRTRRRRRRQWTLEADRPWPWLRTD